MTKNHKLKTKNYKLITILGPTSSGKSDLAVKLAKKFNGEIISADSRQVYKGMDIGTGKVTPDTKNSSNSRAVAKDEDERSSSTSRAVAKDEDERSSSTSRAVAKDEDERSSSTFSTGQAKKKYIFTHKGIPHYCIDVASPKRKFTVVQYRKLAIIAINKILKNVRVPILCGGTGFYIRSVIDGIVIPEVPPDWKLRKKLTKKSVQELYKILKKLDPQRAKTIEKKNPRRLIRAIEIVIKTKKPVPAFQKQPLPYPVLIIGIKKSPDELKKLIKKRLLKRFRQGMIFEVKKLKKSGVSWKRLEEFGLEYRYIARYLQGKLNLKEMIEKLQKEIERFAKRQITWFKRDKRIHWVKNYIKADKLVKNFLNPVRLAKPLSNGVNK